MKYVIDYLEPKSYTIDAFSIQEADLQAKRSSVKGAILCSVKPLEMWEADEIIRSSGRNPDARPPK